MGTAALGNAVLKAPEQTRPIEEFLSEWNRRGIVATEQR
jgi:hypothetical protein